MLLCMQSKAGAGDSKDVKYLIKLKVTVLSGCFFFFFFSPLGQGLFCIACIKLHSPGRHLVPHRPAVQRSVSCQSEHLVLSARLAHPS